MSILLHGRRHESHQFLRLATDSLFPVFDGFLPHRFPGCGDGTGVWWRDSGESAAVPVISTDTPVIAVRPGNVQILAGMGRGAAGSAAEARELIGRIVGTVPDLGLLGERELSELSRAGPAELRRALLLGPERAERLAAAFELGRCVERSVLPDRPSLGSPSRVHAHLAPEVRGLRRETFLCLLLDGRHRLRRIARVSEGTLTSSLVHPREFFLPAVREGAAAVVAAHNHPSGDPEPSDEDVEITRRLVDAGRLLGIPLLDHVVMGDGRYVSMKARLGL